MQPQLSLPVRRGMTLLRCIQYCASTKAIQDCVLHHHIYELENIVCILIWFRFEKAEQNIHYTTLELQQ